MKLAAQLAKLRRQRQARQTVRPSGSAASGRFTRSHLVWLAVGLLVAGGGTWAVFQFSIWNKVPVELVGKWQVQGGLMAGATFEFRRDGAMQMRLRNDAANVAIDGRITVDGKTMQTITQNPTTRREESHKSTIQELTANSLTLELEKGEVLKMVRRK